MLKAYSLYQSSLSPSRNTAMAVWLGGLEGQDARARDTSGWLAFRCFSGIRGVLEVTSTLWNDHTMSVYDTISNLLAGGYGVHSREESEDKSRKFFAGLCAKFGDEEVLEAWRHPLQSQPLQLVHRRGLNTPACRIANVWYTKDIRHFKCPPLEWSTNLKWHESH